MGYTARQAVDARVWLVPVNVFVEGTYYTIDTYRYLPTGTPCCCCSWAWDCCPPVPRWTTTTPSRSPSRETHSASDSGSETLIFLFLFLLVAATEKKKKSENFYYVLKAGCSFWRPCGFSWSFFFFETREENNGTVEVLNGQINIWLTSSLIGYRYRTRSRPCLCQGPVFEPRPGRVCLGVLYHRIPWRGLWSSLFIEPFYIKIFLRLFIPRVTFSKDTVLYRR